MRFECSWQASPALVEEWRAEGLVGVEYMKGFQRLFCTRCNGYVRLDSDYKERHVRDAGGDKRAYN